VSNLRHSDEPANSPDTVLAWRANRLRAAGFPAPLAARLAADGEYDLHALLELVDRGCPVELAVRILAPVAGDSRSC
jgi:hypothetical protein